MAYGIPPEILAMIERGQYSGGGRPDAGGAGNEAAAEAEAKQVLAQAISLTKANRLEEARALIEQVKMRKPELVPYMAQMVVIANNHPANKASEQAPVGGFLP